MKAILKDPPHTDIDVVQFYRDDLLTAMYRALFRAKGDGNMMVFKFCQKTMEKYMKYPLKDPIYNDRSFRHIPVIEI